MAQHPIVQNVCTTFNKAGPIVLFYPTPQQTIGHPCQPKCRIYACTWILSFAVCHFDRLQIKFNFLVKDQLARVISIVQVLRCKFNTMGPHARIKCLPIKWTPGFLFHSILRHFCHQQVHHSCYQPNQRRENHLEVSHWSAWWSPSSTPSRYILQWWTRPSLPSPTESLNFPMDQLRRSQW